MVVYDQFAYADITGKINCDDKDYTYKNIMPDATHFIANTWPLTIKDIFLRAHSAAKFIAKLISEKKHVFMDIDYKNIQQHMIYLIKQYGCAVFQKGLTFHVRSKVGSYLYGSHDVGSKSRRLFPIFGANFEE